MESSDVASTFRQSLCGGYEAGRVNFRLSAAARNQVEMHVVGWCRLRLTPGCPRPDCAWFSGLIYHKERRTT